jgi:site-specific recombinase XerD
MVICDTLASSQCNTRSQQGAERGTGESRCAITTPTPPHTPTAETRHTYISHLVEDGVDPTFVQRQAGHSWASTTAGYTQVGADHANRMLRAALDQALTAERRGGLLR